MNARIAGLILLGCLPVAAADPPRIVPENARLETLFEGGVFTEGPAAAPDGTSG